MCIGAKRLKSQDFLTGTGSGRCLDYERRLPLSTIAVPMPGHIEGESIEIVPGHGGET